MLKAVNNDEVVRIVAEGMSMSLSIHVDHIADM